MKKITLLILLLICSSASAQFNLRSPAFSDQKFIPYKYVACRPDGNGGVTDSDNLSPALQWSDAPAGTRSFVLVVADHDIPQKALLKKSDTVIPKNFPRLTGYHWLLINIPADLSALPDQAGPHKIGVTEYGVQGLNYSGYVNGTEVGGYRGPCPPVNDQLVHRYVFTLYALDTATLNLPRDGRFYGPEVLNALHNHILGKATLVGKFSTKTYNPHLS